MHLIILGVKSPFPQSARATVGYVLEAGGFRLLLDCGFGIHRRLQEEGLLARIDAVFLSHLHCDHCADLPAVILGAGAGRAERLPIFLPPGEEARLRQWFTACGFTFALDHAGPIEIVHGRPRHLECLSIATAPAVHGLPAAIAILEGEGKRMVYTGDTGDCPALRASLRDADLVLSEVSGLPEAEAMAKGHLPAATLGSLAKEAGVNRLVLTHFAPDADPDALAADVEASWGKKPLIAREGLGVEI